MKCFAARVRHYKIPHCDNIKSIALKPASEFRVNELKQGSTKCWHALEQMGSMHNLTFSTKRYSTYVAGMCVCAHSMKETSVHTCSTHMLHKCRRCTINSISMPFKSCKSDPAQDLHGDTRTCIVSTCGCGCYAKSGKFPGARTTVYCAARNRKR